MQEIELIWPGLAPPYTELFAWLEGRAEKPSSSDPAPFRPAMLAHAIEETNFAALDPADYLAEWKWDGIRVQASAGAHDGTRQCRLYSRTGEDISKSFPDLLEALRFDGSIDGELLVVREGRVQSFNVLQQRLNRKSVTPKLIAEFPAHLRAYDLLVDGARRFARAAVRGAPRAARSLHQAPRRSAHRHLAADPVRRPGTSSPPRAPIRPRPAPARMPRRSRA